MSDGLSTEYMQRFGGVERLYGRAGLEHLARAHFAVVGLGGVGSWCAEALARSGVGRLTLIEMDDVCITNTNRQSHAMCSTVGQSKLDVIVNRLRDINPEIQVNPVYDFLTLSNIREHIDSRFHIVIDAADSAYIKAGLIAYCCAVKIRLVTVGSSGGKTDASLVQAGDLGRTQGDPMLVKVRTQLYRRYKFARDANRKFRVDTIFSPEQMVYPKPDGSVCMDKQVLQDGVKLDCAGGFGSSVMVTGTFGFMAAQQAIKRYLQRF